MIKIGMTLGDRYEILEKIGTGGMSDVYKAKDGKLNRFVAVKVLKQEFAENANFVSKFRTEAQAAAGMMHPNIVNVYDVGEEGGTHYIVMELVEGITLKKYIEKKARLSIKETISIAIQVSMGIEAAHNNHIIHRDIKPQNIMISKEGKVKVTDFGIAKAVSSNTITSNVMGSVHYTSPEQARGGFSDEKSDIYSLGITMFEMLTGRVPFNGETTVAIAIKHIQEPMPSPREYVAEIPISVEQIVFKCTQKSPDRRYQSMGELITDLKRSLMKPDEDFVKIADPDEDSPTRMVSQAEMRQIKSKTERIAVDDIRMRTTEPSDEKPVKRQKKGSKKNQKQVKNARSASAAKTRGAQKPPQQKKRRPENVKVDKKRARQLQQEPEEQDEFMEKLTTVLAIIAALVIGILVIFFVGRHFGLFEFGTTDTDITDKIDDLPVITEEPAVDNTDDENDGKIEVPNVINLSYAEAVATLNKKGFKQIEKVQISSTTVDKGNVAEQTPAAGEKAASDDTIVLAVSTGAEIVQVKVPSVIGMSEMDATAVLVEHGLQVGTVTEATDPNTNLIDKVCYQSYAADVTVESGTKVDLRISIGTGEKVYYYVGNIESPGSEDSEYTPGSEATVILSTIEGIELKRESVTSFPVSMNITGITGSGEGVITIIYNVTIPGTTTTDEDGNITTSEATTEERTVRRSVKFSEE
ncbi:MAG: Stk1 family PASTA domain-containing Ser/Thr kinase [Lachnospiraceae bacterium]|nr:Stk1 family PASTA domain-containing Ser/Thr kinase [Lachnospiraceae bacterium]